jgi:DNA polymerase family A
MNKITSSYLHSLQGIYYAIGDRGIHVDHVRIIENKHKIKEKIQDQLDIASAQWGCTVFIGASNDPGKAKNAVNLNATQGERALLAKMKEIGYNIPKITKKNEEGDYEQKYSTGELALQKMLIENKFNFPTGDPAIRAILKVRELGKILSVYLSSRLLPRCEDEKWNYYFLSIYNVAGTLTGRRTSRKHTFGFGGNAQNFPSHSASARYFRECLIPRPGGIFLFVDQIQAEEWPVSALSSNFSALTDLRTNYLPDKTKRVDRHSELASRIFGKKIPWKSSPEWNKSYDMERYLGKKIKHARNYGMKKNRMSESLAQEGFCINPTMCELLLLKAAEVDPTVDTVFHSYIQEQLSLTHLLRTPFGRERLFIGAKPNADNSSLFNEAYSYIPQSVVGDNTGFAVFELETLYPKEERRIVQEGHDSIVQDIPFERGAIVEYMRRTKKAFERKITFHNGIEIEIPIEAEIGFDFETHVPLDNMDAESLDKSLDELAKLREKKTKEQSLAA